MKQAELSITVDGNVALLVEGRIRSKIALARLIYQLHEGRTVVLREKPRRLFGEAARETVRFRFSEEAEEFLCFC